jgi:hypothetical protein
MAFGRPTTHYVAESLPVSCRLAVVVAALPVILLGVYIPVPVHDLPQLAARQLGGH